MKKNVKRKRTRTRTKRTGASKAFSFVLLKRSWFVEGTDRQAQLIGIDLRNRNRKDSGRLHLGKKNDARRGCQAAQGAVNKGLCSR